MLPYGRQKEGKLTVRKFQGRRKKNGLDRNRPWGNVDFRLVAALERVAVLSLRRKTKTGLKNDKILLEGKKKGGHPEKPL